MEEYIAVISQVGFPIFAFLLMYRLVDTTIKQNTSAIESLVRVVESCEMKKNVK